VSLRALVFVTYLMDYFDKSGIGTPHTSEFSPKNGCKIKLFVTFVFYMLVKSTPNHRITRTSDADA